jgi:ABC-type hemin transport system ATPase subunit
MRYIADFVEAALTDGKMAFIAGPRQVGKTTLARLIARSGRGYLSWDARGHSRRAGSRPAPRPDLTSARRVLDTPVTWLSRSTPRR